MSLLHVSAKISCALIKGTSNLAHTEGLLAVINLLYWVVRGYLHSVFGLLCTSHSCVFMVKNKASRRLHHVYPFLYFSVTQKQGGESTASQA